MTATACECCALHGAGDEENVRAWEIDSVRSQRLLLTLLGGAEDAAAEIATEVNGCLMCTGRLACIYLFNYADALRHLAGTNAEAMRWAQGGLMQDLDAADR